MAERSIDIWIPKRIRSKKGEMVRAELEEFWRELRSKKFRTVVLEDWDLYMTSDSWLLVRKGFAYLPEIIDSMVFGVSKLLDKYCSKAPFGIRYLAMYPEKVREGIREMYPHAGKLLEKGVDVRVKRIEIGYEKYHLCWPVSVIGFEEVMDEANRLSKGRCSLKTTQGIGN